MDAHSPDSNWLIGKAFSFSSVKRSSFDNAVQLATKAFLLLRAGLVPTSTLRKDSSSTFYYLVNSIMSSFLLFKEE